MVLFQPATGYGTSLGQGAMLQRIVIFDAIDEVINRAAFGSLRAYG